VRRRRTATVLALAALVGAAVPAAHAAFADRQARNFTKQEERATYEHGRPGYQKLLAEKEAESLREVARIRRTDPERDFSGNACGTNQNACAGDVRLYDWEERGFGRVNPVLYTARSGATIEGNVWATRAGPRRRPGVVITTGSVQAPEELYLWAATTLAKNGYVVMTYDVQGQGRSDTRGEPPDEDENVPSQQPSTFVDGTEDALRFFRSSRRKRYAPLPSRTSGTSHDDKQQRRVREGLNSRHNPLWHLLDKRRIGLAGHSLGASAVSKVASQRKGVDAVVGWDNLSVGRDGDRFDPRVPGLGMSADYGLFREPIVSRPDPDGKSEASLAYSRAEVDTMQINHRGGTHYEWSYIPNPVFGATLRGMHMGAWYATAWFDKYLKPMRSRDRLSADRRLLTKRWLWDRATARIDPEDDGNMYSFYYDSRLDFDLVGGGHVRCEDLRRTCRRKLNERDGEPPRYSYLREARTPDRG
jgi:dienelactone hydrolase